MNEQPNQTPNQPGIYPGENAPEVKPLPYPDREMPFRRGRPGRDEPEIPAPDVPQQPGRTAPEVPAPDMPQRDAPPPLH